MFLVPRVRYVIDKCSIPSSLISVRSQRLHICLPVYGKLCISLNTPFSHYSLFRSVIVPMVEEIFPRNRIYKSNQAIRLIFHRMPKLTQTFQHNERHLIIERMHSSSLSSIHAENRIFIPLIFCEYSPTCFP